MVKAKRVNLNKSIEDSSRKKQQVFENTKMKIFFNGFAIVNALCRQIRKKETHYILGACAWLTNTKIIDTIAGNTKGCCFIVTKDKITKGKQNMSQYRRLKKLPLASSSINTIGAGRGYNKSLMHHKFLVGLNENKKPIWVSNGSFNLTKSAVNHIENVMIIDDENVAALFRDEFMRLFPISRPLKL